MLRQRNQPASSSPSILTLDATERKNVQTASVLLLWHQLASWQQDNSHIHGSYRPASSSFAVSLASLSYLHNESVNIYSHLLGAIALSTTSLLLYYTLAPRYASASQSDALAFSCFFVGAAACLGMSATYHTISNHSHKVARIGNKLDYVGIVFLIWGSFIPSIFYGFCGQAKLQQTYWSMISILAVGCAAVSIFERFRTPAWRPYRAAMFVAMGLSAVIPVLHGVELYGIRTMQERIGLNWLLLQGFLYILGAGIYAVRWPECSRPGKFDVWGASHQIFHVLVLAAAASHLMGLLTAFDNHHGVFGRGC